MAQSGFTPILIYGSTTASAVPLAANLTTSSAGVELAVNAADGKLYYKDSGGNVQVLAGKGGTGVVAGSNTQVQFNNNGVFGAAAGLTWDGTNFTANSIKDSALTSGRVTYAGTSGLLQDSANLTFDGTTLTAAGLAGPHNGTVGATTPNTGAFTTLSASSTVSGAGFSTYLASPPAIGGTAANTGAFTTLAASGNVTLSAGTANGVAYLNGSKVLTTGSALTFDGTVLSAGRISATSKFEINTYPVLDSSGGNVRVGDIGFNIGGVAFFASGSEQMRLTSTGLGIGTSSVSYKLSVEGAANSGDPAIPAQIRIASTEAFNTSPTAGILFVNKWTSGGGVAGMGGIKVVKENTTDGNFAGYMSFLTRPNGGTITEYMRLDSSGNLGIGTTSPTRKLSVSGAANLVGTAGTTFDAFNIGGSTTAAAYTTIVNTTGQLRSGVESSAGGVLFAGSSAYASVIGTVGATALQLGTNTTIRATLDTSGNLGLGVTPSASNIPTFQSSVAVVVGNSETDITSNAYYNSGWKYVGTGLATQYQANGGLHKWYTAPSGTAGNAISFSQVMTLDASGNLGIGTSSPGVKLDTVGVMRSTFNSTSNGGPGSHGLELRQSTTSTKALIAGYSTSGNQTGAYIQAVNFGTAYEDLVLQPQGGNLGLGVTPSAWYSTVRAIQMGSGAVLEGRSNSSFVAAIGTNYYLESTAAANTYIATGAATKYLQTTGTHQWFTAPSGTAGNAISFTQAMTLNTNGDLGVGTTSISSRMHIANAGDVNYRAQNTSSNSVLLAGADSVGGYVGTFSNHPAVFYTNSTERARIDSSGNFMVGTTTQRGQGGITLTPNTSAGAGEIAFNRNSTTSTSFVLGFQNAGTTVGYISYNNSTVTYNTGSDARLKENVAAAPASGPIIDAINIVQHDWKSGGHVDYSVIAQDLHQVFPQAVTPGDDGEHISQTWGVDYSKFVPLLVKEIQSLRARVAALEAA